MTNRFEISCEGSSASKKPTFDSVIPRFCHELPRYPADEVAHVIPLREVQVVEHVIRGSVADVASVEVERRKHNAHPELLSATTTSHEAVHLTMTFQSTARRVSRSSRHVHLNLGSNAS